MEAKSSHPDVFWEQRQQGDQVWGEQSGKEPQDWKGGPLSMSS